VGDPLGSHSVFICLKVYDGNISISVTNVRQNLKGVTLAYLVSLSFFCVDVLFIYGIEDRIFESDFCVSVLVVDCPFFLKDSDGFVS